MAKSVKAVRRSPQISGTRKAGLVLSGIVLAACLVPAPVEAASPGRTLQRSPETTSQAPATCRPKWPYIVLTCVA